MQSLKHLIAELISQAEKQNNIIDYVQIYEVISELDYDVKKVLIAALNESGIVIENLPEEFIDEESEMEEYIEPCYEDSMYCSKSGKRRGPRSEYNLKYEQEREVYDYIQKVLNTPLISVEEYNNMIRRHDAGDETVMKELVERSMRLVLPIARRYHNYYSKISYMDLIQEGNMGLMKAVSKFNFHHGKEYYSYGLFSAYAKGWIKKYISEAAKTHGYAFRISPWTIDLNKKIKNTIVLLKRDLRREPTIKEIADVLGEKPERVEKILMLDMPVKSISLVISEENDNYADKAVTIEDCLEDKTQNIEEIILQKEIVTTVQDVINECISPQEREIITSRYHEQKTLKETGERLGLTESQVYRLEKNILKKLAVNKEIKELKGD